MKTPSVAWWQTAIARLDDQEKQRNRRKRRASEDAAEGCRQRVRDNEDYGGDDTDDNGDGGECDDDEND